MNADEVLHAADLCKARTQLRELASRLLSDNAALFVSDGTDVFEVANLIDELHALVRREYETQLASIDAKLQALGVVTEPQPLTS